MSNAELNYEMGICKYILSGVACIVILCKIVQSVPERNAGRSQYQHFYQQDLPKADIK